MQLSPRNARGRTVHTVVVTGASSGIGAAIARRLAGDGFVVFAGVRQESDRPRLAALDANIRPVILDITDASSIAAAAASVASESIPLAGVINNAGIAVAGPLEFLPLDELRRQFEVNVFGQIAVAQAFLPQLRSSRGRLVFIGSISGRFAVPFIAPYSASKFALRALVDAMRIELRPFGVAVSLVEPGSVKTPIWSKGRAANEELLRRLPEKALIAYAQALQSVLRLSEREERAGIAPARVVDAVLHALRAPRPRAHYLVGTPARLGSLLVTLLPPRLHDRFVRAAMRLP